MYAPFFRRVRLRASVEGRLGVPSIPLVRASIKTGPSPLQLTKGGMYPWSIL